MGGDSWQSQKIGRCGRNSCAPDKLVRIISFLVLFSAASGSFTTYQEWMAGYQDHPGWPSETSLQAPNASFKLVGAQAAWRVKVRVET